MMSRWPNSAIFGVDMFGSAVGTPENDYEINEGWFTNVTSLYDPDSTFVSGFPNLRPGHNPYGFIGLTIQARNFSFRP